MKKTIITTGLLSCILSFGFSQTTITLQPDATMGKDAQVFDNLANTNMGSHSEFEIYAWTNGGSQTIRRCFIDFDFSLIPAGSTITSTNFVLYNNPTSTSTNGEHSQTSGSNEMVIERVIQSWDENIITWNNQPNTVTLNQIIVPPSTSSHQDYSMDISSLVQDIVDNPSTSFGLRLTLLTEQYYRSLIFASSDHTNSNLHPKLIITYTNPVGIEVAENSTVLLKIYPNPTSNQLTINTEIEILEIEIIDLTGKIIMTTNGNSTTINVTDLTPGSYFIKVITEENTITKKFVKQ